MFIDSTRQLDKLQRSEMLDAELSATFRAFPRVHSARSELRILMDAGGDYIHFVPTDWRKK
jgi:hypothetical protein